MYIIYLPQMEFTEILFKLNVFPLFGISTWGNNQQPQRRIDRIAK